MDSSKFFFGLSLDPKGGTCHLHDVGSSEDEIDVVADDGTYRKSFELTGESGSQIVDWLGLCGMDPKAHAFVIRQLSQDLARLLEELNEGENGRNEA